jgi:hypothetical protein
MSPWVNSKNSALFAMLSSMPWLVSFVIAQPAFGIDSRQHLLDPILARDDRF